MSNNESSHTEEFETLCAGYVLQALDERDQARYEEMLANGTQEERMMHQELSSTASQLAFTVDRVQPSEDLKQRILQEINVQQEGSEKTPTPIDRSEPTEEQGGGTNWSAFAAAASIALLVISLALIFYSFNLNSKLSDKSSVIKDQNTTISKLKSNLEKKKQMLSILSARDVDLVAMNGLEVNPNGYGKVIWDSKRQKALLQVSNLPAISSNKSYQLWIIKNNKPVPSGIFAVNQSSNSSFFKISQMAKANEKNASSFAITLEPKGGSPTGKPTGDMYLLGNVKKNGSS